VQTIGRAARNVNGKVIMYADKMTDSMTKAIKETKRRRAIQMEYNQKHQIVPKTVKKDIRDLIAITKAVANDEKNIKEIPNYDEMSKKEKEHVIANLEKEMREAAKVLDFEVAATLRDTILELKAKK
jgi:excinuclease ABC subunit B